MTFEERYAIESLKPDTDENEAAKILRAVRHLNTAIMAAADLGLKVELYIRDTRCIGKQFHTVEATVHRRVG